MSVVVALPKNGVVYFAADNQTTASSRAFEIDSEEAYKLQVIGDWVVGSVGNVNYIQLCLNVLNKLKDKPLSKELIVKEFIPEFIKEATEAGFIDKDNKYKSFDNAMPSFLIGCKGDLYEVSSSLVLKIETVDTVGSGETFLLNSINEDMAEEDINDNLVKAIRRYGSNNIYVNKNVELANTRDLKVEVLYDRNL